METFKSLLALPFELMRSTDTVDALMGWLLLTLLVTCAGLVAYAVMGAVYGLIDELGLEVRHEEGVVTRKVHHPGRTESYVSYNPALRMMMPSSYYVPPRWEVRASLRNGLEGWMRVSYEQFGRIEDLRKLRATYRVGRLTGRVYIDRLEIDRS